MAEATFNSSGKLMFLVEIVSFTSFINMLVFIMLPKSIYSYDIDTYDSYVIDI